MNAFNGKARRVIVLDTETTGIQAYDRIITLGAVRVEDGVLTDEWLHHVYDPRKDSHPGALAIHGWDDWTTRFQDLFADHAEHVLDWFSWADLLVAHNARFDLHYLNRELRKSIGATISTTHFCTLNAAQRYWAASAALDDCLSRIGLSRAGRLHGALEDAVLTANLYCYLANAGSWRARLPELGPPSNYREPTPPPDGPLPRRTPKRARGQNRAAVDQNARSATAPLRDATRPAAILLMSIARADGVIASEEASVIETFIADTSTKKGIAASQSVRNALTKEYLDLDPTPHLITRATKAILADSYLRQTLPAWISRMPTADGRVVASEMVALEALKAAIVRARQAVAEGRNDDEGLDHTGALRPLPASSPA
jgi:DNA polymerase III epsilon subunit-like protein